MVFDLSKITGLGNYTLKTAQDRTLYFKNEKVFLVAHKNTIEIRCDTKLAAHLKEKYESIMESRYFGRGGIEIVLAGQLNQSELADLVRLSYNLTS
ncbi:hypothetical protein IKF89_00560 [Candidatus Saccharibacteria bacterium]|nr:hypothetical protein [Candidatus Saccharibacteria bacterium]